MSARFELLAGDSMTGKTYSLARQVLEEAHAYPDKKFYIIVPEQAGNAYEKKLIQMNQALFGTPGFMNIDILGFNRLSYRIFEEFAITETSVLEEYEKNMLVRVASGKVRRELEIYGGSIDRTGFTKEIKSLISEMIQYNVSPEELENAARDIEKDREGLSAKLRDVSKIYQVFMDILDSRRSALSLGDEVDLSMTISEERFKLLARILKTDRPSSLVDGAVFVFATIRIPTGRSTVNNCANLERAISSESKFKHVLFTFSLGVSLELIRSSRSPLIHCTNEIVTISQLLRLVAAF
jgi:hypothetical protein